MQECNSLGGTVATIFHKVSDSDSVTALDSTSSSSASSSPSFSYSIMAQNG
jgi:hypothetical protein